jgi:hypothetical protein
MVNILVNWKDDQYRQNQRGGLGDPPGREKMYESKKSRSNNLVKARTKGKYLYSFCELLFGAIALLSSYGFECSLWTTHSLSQGDVQQA